MGCAHLTLPGVGGRTDGAHLTCPGGLGLGGALRLPKYDGVHLTRPGVGRGAHGWCAFDASRGWVAHRWCHLTRPG
eukprot:4720120-Prymnesium_polylepis.1